MSKMVNGYIHTPHLYMDYLSHTSQTRPFTVGKLLFYKKVLASIVSALFIF